MCCDVTFSSRCDYGVPAQTQVMDPRGPVVLLPVVGKDARQALKLTARLAINQRTEFSNYGMHM